MCRGVDIVCFSRNQFENLEQCVLEWEQAHGGWAGEKGES